MLLITNMLRTNIHMPNQKLEKNSYKLMNFSSVLRRHFFQDTSNSNSSTKEERGEILKSMKYIIKQFNFFRHNIWSILL